MSSHAIPVNTRAARQLLAGPRSILTVQMRMLLINVDGRRTASELQDIARSLSLAPHALEELQRGGFITGLAESRHGSRATETPAAHAKAAKATNATWAADDLRLLM